MTTFTICNKQKKKEHSKLRVAFRNFLKAIEKTYAGLLGNKQRAASAKERQDP